MELPKLFKNFKFWWTFYYVFISITVGIWIAKVDGFDALDGIFMAASGMCGAGLTSVPMRTLNTTGFVWTGILMFFGSPTFMLLPTILYRRSCFNSIHGKDVKTFQNQRTRAPFTKKNLRIIEETYLIYESLYFLTNIILLYYTLWMIFGILGIYGTLKDLPLNPELAERGAEYIDSAVYTAISAFANTGYTMTSDSLVDLFNNPPCYVIISLLILAGNTALPIFLRNLIVFLRYCNRKFTTLFGPEEKNHFSIHEPYNYYFNRETIFTFILHHPRSLTTHLFTEFQTRLLIFMVLELITIQYVFFILSTVLSSSLLQKYPLPVLLGIGYFQTLSTRSAGFAMMDLRYLNQGLLFVYFIMMYISSFPFVTTLHNSNEHTEEDDKGDDEEERDINQSHAAIGDEIGEEEAVKNIDELIGHGEREKKGSVIKTLFSTNKEIYNSVIRNMELQTKHHTSTTEIARRRSSADTPPQLNPLHAPPLEGKKNPSATSLDIYEEEDEEGHMQSHLTRQLSTGSTKQSTLTRRRSVSPIPDTTPPPAAAISEEPQSADQQFTKKVLLRHTFFLILVILILSYSEDTLMSTTQYDVNLWYIMFEMISAYGSVGLSLGIPGKEYSLSGQMSNLGKCCIIFIMFLGKHRGLPNKNDEVIDFSFEKFRLAYLSCCDFFDEDEDDDEDDRIVEKTNNTTSMKGMSSVQVIGTSTSSKLLDTATISQRRKMSDGRL